MSAQLALGAWAPPDTDAQPPREPRTPREPKPRRTRRDKRADDDDRLQANPHRPLTKEELQARGRAELEAMIRKRYTRLGVEPPRDDADRARADAQLAAVQAARKARADAEGGTWIYGTFMTWAEYEAEFERREGRRPGDPLTPQQKKGLTWQGAR